jgi:RNA polymerase sigma factor (sigma-70 family)
MTDKELEKIYSEAYRAVYWTAMSLLKNEADAEDVVQETFVTLIESYDTIKDKNKVTAWLKKITVNKCLDRIKLTRTDNMDEEFFDSVEAVPEDFLPDTIIESEEMRRIVMNIIEKSLSDDVRRTLILFYFDEMSTKEIAEALGIPQGTVSWRINFAKKTIKKEVEKYEKENNTKLFGMALPFLSKLFMKEAEQVPFKVMSASLTSTLSASAKASTQGAGTKVAATAAKKGTGIMINKVVIGSVAATVSVAAVGGAIAFLLSRNDTKPTEPIVIEETIETTEAQVTAVATTAADTTETTAAAKDDHLYSLDGLTVDETMQLLVDLSRISDVDRDNPYLAKFPVTPRVMDEDQNIYNFKNSGATNCITNVTLDNVTNEADGTISKAANGMVHVKLTIEDAAYAEALYDKAFETMCGYAEGASSGEQASISDSRDNVFWSSDVLYQVEVGPRDKYDVVSKIDGNTHYYKLVHCYITMNEMDGQYKLKIELPLI